MTNRLLNSLSLKQLIFSFECGIIYKEQHTVWDGDTNGNENERTASPRGFGTNRKV